MMLHIEKQRRFITDAGHEIRTLLSIIRADTDVLEMEMGENEWLKDIQKQTERLTALTNELVYLSCMAEEEQTLSMTEFSLSGLVEESVFSFRSIARTQHKELQCEIPPALSLVGNEKMIGQLVNILLDNAMKYSPEQGVISVKVQKEGKHMVLTVSNSAQELFPKEKLDLLFERFYRTDASCNTHTGGYGIGLSVASAIVKAHKGKIYASSTEENCLKITVVLPIQNR